MPTETGSGFLVDDQAEVIGFLAALPGTLKRIDTHGASVFIHADRVYKLKRAVRFSFMDFSDTAKRKAAVIAEIRLNRRTAPTLYLGAAAVIKDVGGVRLSPLIADPDEAERAYPDALDWVVIMQPFDEETLYDRLADRGELDLGRLSALARHIADFHASAERIIQVDAVARLGAVLEGNIADLGSEPLFDGMTEVGRIAAACRRLRTSYGPMIDARGKSGFVRRLHGDLHLGNICEVEGKPTLFDCIEFNDDFAVIDCLYDLSFLLMDLLYRGLSRECNFVLNRYLEETGDYGGLSLLPLMLSMRAQIRAKVTAAAASMQSDPQKALRMKDAALSYLRLALDLLEDRPLRLVAVGGASGSGKSTVARGLAPFIGGGPGAVVLRSDAIRKRLWGAGELDRLPQEAYGPEIGERTYTEMERLAGEVLAQGVSVIADATFTKPESRRRISDVSSRAGAIFTGLWLEASPEELVRRVDARRGDVSDATAKVVENQLAQDWGVIDWKRLATGGPLEDTLIGAHALIREDV